MADEIQKVDPVGDEFYRPLNVADRVSDFLFYCSAVLSIAAWLSDQKTMPVLFSVVQIAFALSVLALFTVGIAIRLHFAPRAQFRRYQDFLSHAYDRPLSHRQSTAYYNNSCPPGSRRIAAQVLESTFFSGAILAKMAVWERGRILVYACLWVIAVLNRNTDLAIITIAAQIIFSEQILSKWLRLEWLRGRCEQIYDDVFRLFQSKGEVEVVALEMLGRYEIAKATAVISMSPRVFEKNRERMNAGWNSVRAALQI
jgi:hypothetical protein